MTTDGPTVHHRIDIGQGHNPPEASPSKTGGCRRRVREPRVITRRSRPEGQGPALLRRLWETNNISKKDRFPLSRIDDTRDTLAGAKWFSTPDLKNGYWQVTCIRTARRRLYSRQSSDMGVHGHALWPLQRSSDV
jgi:hypothetical protein